MFSVSIYGILQDVLNSTTDRGAPNDEVIHVYFNNYTWHEVNCSESGGGPAEYYTTSIELLDENNNPLTGIDIEIGESFTIRANYSLFKNGIYEGYVDGTVVLDLELDSVDITDPSIQLDHMGGGIYNVTLDTSEEIPGGGTWLGGEDYDAIVTGSKAGYGETDDSVTISLSELETRISTNETTSSANWREMITLNVIYQYNNSGVWTGITGASVSFYELDNPDVFGDCVGLGNGIYRLSINTTKFPDTGTYKLIISATLQNYKAQTKYQTLIILEMSSLINGSETTIHPEAYVYLSNQYIFYLNYTDAPGYNFL